MLILVRALCAHHVDMLFPLMQFALPRLTLSAWRDYAKPLVRSGGDRPSHGIMVAKSPNGVVRGAFVYRVETRRGEHDAASARHLAVSHVAVPDIARKPVLNALARSMDELAADSKCRTIRITMAETADWEIDYFKSLGHEIAVVAPPDAPVAAVGPDTPAN